MLQMIRGLDKTSKALIYISSVISLSFAAAGTVILNDGAPCASSYEYLTLIGKRGEFLPGIFLGLTLTVVKIALIDRSCKKALEMDANTAKLYVFAGYFIRFFLSGAVFFAVLNMKGISFLGVFLGAVSLRLSVFALPFLGRGAVRGS